MEIFLNFFNIIGEKTIKIVEDFFEALKFTSICSIQMIKLSSYSHSMKQELVMQIYLMGIKVIPIFLFMAFVLGYIIVGVVISLSIEYGLNDNIGLILTHLVVDEAAPFFTILFFVLRFSTLTNTEISIMSINNELKSYNDEKIDIINNLFLPRIIAGMISVSSLSIIFAIIMLCSGYIYALFYMGIDIYTYKMMIINSIEVKNIVILVFKSVAFGFVAMMIPVYSGLKSKPLKLKNGMIKLFIAIVFIEIMAFLMQLI
jgi:phospholipid/cholesterol/gamma-HCH transport system permease protein